MLHHDVYDARCCHHGVLSKPLSSKRTIKEESLTRNLPLRLMSASTAYNTAISISTMHVLNDSVAVGNLEGCISLVKLDAKNEYTKVEKSVAVHKKLHQSVIYDMKIMDPSNNTMVSCSMDKSVKIWSHDLTEKGCLTQGQEKIKFIAVDEGKPELLATGCKYGLVKLWDVNKMLVESTLNLSSGEEIVAVEGLDFRLGSNVLAITCNRGILKLVDRRNLTKSIFSVWRC